MASSSEKTPSSGGDSTDESKNTPPALNWNGPGLACLQDYNSASKELSKKMEADPAHTQAMEVLKSVQGGNLSESDRKQFNDALNQLSQSNREYLLQNPHISQSLENFGNPVALQQFAERVAQMGKDPDLKPILTEIEARGPAAVYEYFDDKDALKKLSKSMGTATLSDMEGVNKDDEQVSQGRKALQILCGYIEMKAANVLWVARRKKKNKSGRKEKRAKPYPGEGCCSPTAKRGK